MKSKSIIQIRSHAQKYFLKIEKLGTGEVVPPPRPKKKASRPYPHKAVPPPPRPKAVEPKQEQTKFGGVAAAATKGSLDAGKASLSSPSKKLAKKQQQKQDVSQSNNNTIDVEDDGNKKAKQTTPKREKKSSKAKARKKDASTNTARTTTKKSSLLHLGNEPPADDLFRSDDQLAGMIDNEVEEKENDEDDDDENNREIMNSNEASGGGSAEDDAINCLVQSDNVTATTSYKESGGHNKELMMTATNFINNSNNNNYNNSDDDNSGGSKSNQQFMTREYIAQQINEMQEQVRNSLTGSTYEERKGTKRKAPNTPTSKGSSRGKSNGSGGPSRLGSSQQQQQQQQQQQYPNQSAHGSNLGGVQQVNGNDQLQHSEWNPTQNNSLAHAQRKKENQNTPNFQVVYSAFAKMLENGGVSAQEAMESLQNMRPIDRETTILLIDNSKKNLLSKRMWEDQMQLVASGYQTFLNARAEEKQAKLVESMVNSMKFNNKNALDTATARLSMDSLVPPSPATQQTQLQPPMQMTKRDSDGTFEEANDDDNNNTNTDSGNNESANEKKGSEGGSGGTGGTGQSQQTFVEVAGKKQVSNRAAAAAAQL